MIRAVVRGWGPRGQVVRWVSEKSVTTFSAITGSKEECIECGSRHDLLIKGVYCIYFVFGTIGDVLGSE